MPQNRSPLSVSRSSTTTTAPPGRRAARTAVSDSTGCARVQRLAMTGARSCSSTESAPRASPDKRVSGGGWNGDADAGALVRGEWFDVIGFSLGAEIHLGALTEVIRAVKHETCNPHVVVLVGGPLFAEHPDYMRHVGADGMTIDGREAPALAERLIAEAARLSGSKRAASRAGSA